MIAPPSEKKTAAPVGAGNGGRKLENPPKIFKENFYTASDRNAIARLPARITAGDHFIIWPLSGGRWRLVVNTWTGGRVEFFDTEAEANRARLELSDREIPGFTFGGAIR